MKTIRRDDFCPGMYVYKFGKGTFDDPDVFIDEPIMSVVEFNDLVPPYVDELIIDPDKYQPLDGVIVEPPDEKILSASTPFAEEFANMDELYNEALFQMKELFTGIRKGRGFDYQTPNEIALDMVDSVFRNEHAAVAATKTRRFDDYLLTHSLNVSILSVVLGKYIGLSVDQLCSLAMAGLFHDIGKCRIPMAILNKPGKLTDDEFRTIKRHPFESYAMLRRQKNIPEEVLKGVLHHHERYDGSGYPYGLLEDELSIFAGVLGIVDVYDAMTSKKGYGTTMAPAAALRKMFGSMTNSFPVEQVEELIGCIGVYPAGSMVRMVDGRYGVVTGRGKASSIKPIVKIILGMDFTPIASEEIDLSKSTDKGLGLHSFVDPNRYGIDIALFLK
ncbi:MAG: HD domain-containing phosphohydrolase [Desulfovibrio sp.]